MKEFFQATAIRRLEITEEEIITLICKVAGIPQDLINKRWRDGVLVIELSATVTEDMPDSAPYEGYKIQPEVRFILKQRDDQIKQLERQLKEKEDEIFSMAAKLSGMIPASESAPDYTEDYRDDYPLESKRGYDEPEFFPFGSK